MKSILYVGATLMIGASIYGFVDYKQTSHQKEFTGMYTEEKEKVPVRVAADSKPAPAVTSKKAAPAVTKKPVVAARENTVVKKSKKKKINTKLFSRGSLEDRYIEPRVKVEEKQEPIKKTENKEQ